jgi:hypothetical protein
VRTRADAKDNPPRLENANADLSRLVEEHYYSLLALNVGNVSDLQFFIVKIPNLEGMRIRACNEERISSCRRTRFSCVIWTLRL